MDTAKVAAARLWASGQQPYLSAALFACDVVPAAGTGGVRIGRSWRVRADPAVVDGLDVPQLGRLLLHLCAHVVRGHADRAEAIGVADDDRGFWTACADAEINDDLAAAGLLPPLADTRPADLGAVDGRLAEAYFADGTSPLGAAGPGRPVSRCGAGADGSRDADGEGLDDGGLTPAQAQLLRLAVARQIAEQQAREPGSVPGGWARWAGALVSPVIDWRRVLGAEIRRAIAATAGAVDYTYRRPARRGPAGVPRPVLPTLVRPVPNVAVVCDTSGSMGEAQLATVLAEIDGLLARAGLRARPTPVLAVDTEVHALRRVTRAAQVSLAGGGGTDMAAGIAAAAALRPRPDLVVVLTDGWTPWPDHPPRGVRVVVALVEAPGLPAPVDDVPAWARTVVVESPT